MLNQNKKRLIWIAIGCLAVVLIAFRIYQNKQPGEYDDLAKCLKEKGATFYGAFWCSHCQNQKALFGKSKQYLPYVECSTEDGQGQIDLCKEKGIKGYPTWIFADGSEASREFSLEELAEKTGCKLPQ